jgi:hypothetical protein
MKIILTAFNNRLQSEPMIVPENTTQDFYLDLEQPLTAIAGYSGQQIGEIPKLNTRCKFTSTRKHVSLDNEEWAEIYTLSEIINKN